MPSHSNNAHIANPIQIFIKPMVSVPGISGRDGGSAPSNGGQSFVLTASCDESVDALRSLIFHKTHIVPNRQVLLFQNKVLQSGMRLNEYHGLCDNATVEVRYSNHSDWFDRGRQDIDCGIIRLNGHIEALEEHRHGIEAVTEELAQKIKSAPTLCHLERCKIDDAADREMAALHKKVGALRALLSGGSVTAEIRDAVESLSQLISKAITSVNQEEGLRVHRIDRKIAEIECEIKVKEAMLSDLETEKATVRSNSDQHRGDLAAVRTEHVERAKARLSALCNVDMASIVDALRDSKEERFKELERVSSEWDTENLEVWIRSINRRHFDRSEFDSFFESLRSECVDGGNLQELASGVCCGLLGLSGHDDQQLLIREVNGLLRLNMDNDFIVRGNRCCACLAKCIECVLCPCGHQPYCFQCANTARDHDNRCPICRTQITQVMRTWISGV